MPLIDVDRLAEALSADRPVRLLDVRWRLDLPEGRPAYLTGHLPGAVYVDLERELAAVGHPEKGRLPEPALADLQHAVRRWGVDDGDLVVAYDDNDGVAAARAWWLLRSRGVDVRVLDGGIRAWIASGRTIEYADRAPRAGTAVLVDADPGAVTIDEAARAPLEGVLVDVRAPEQYRGRAASPDPAAGHIPGAINLPTVTHIGPDGRLRSRDEIARTLASAGISAGAPVTLYCGAGVASTHSALAFAIAGIDARVYVGSWSQWSRSPGRAVAIGPTPSATLRGW